MVKTDLNKDGEITDLEIARSEKLLELELREEKAESHKKMAWVAIASMVGITFVMVWPDFLSDDRVKILDSIVGTFYVAQASIVGFYFGANAYMTRTSAQLTETKY